MREWGGDLSVYSQLRIVVTEAENQVFQGLRRV
jgi:hypothetical protein